MADSQPPTWGFSAGKPFNYYRCEKCRQYTVSKDLADGVTPFMIRCHATQDCQGMAQSCFYRVPQTTHQQPHIIWYKPSPDELAQYVANLDPIRQEEVKEHVNKGGLLMRIERRPDHRLPWGMRPRQA